jgi:hypothetical protein
VSVKFYVSATTSYRGWVKIEHGFKEISNPVTDFGDNVNWDIFHKHTNVPANGMNACSLAKNPLLSGWDTSRRLGKRTAAAFPP